VCVWLSTGATLKEFIVRSRGLDTYTALMLMQNLLRILVYLQSKNVIHNDIKGTARNSAADDKDNLVHLLQTDVENLFIGIKLCFSILVLVSGVPFPSNRQRQSRDLHQNFTRYSGISGVI